jgi:tetratricopeptide (TPR) repeat protein
VSAVDGYHFFSETFDRTLEDIFEVQDEIAQMITNRLREHLSEEEIDTPLVRSPTSNLEAYETYLRGLYFLNQWEDEAITKAIPLFEKAIELQEDFGLPHARLIIANFIQAFSGKSSIEEAYRKSSYHIKRVRELDVDTAEAYFGNAVFEFFYNWDWEKCWKYTREGVNRYPNFPSLHHMVSTLYYVKGDMDKAIVAHLKGFQRDPLSIEMLMYLAIAYFWNREFDNALPYFNQLLDMLPHHRTAKEYKGWIYAHTGDYEQALALFNELEPVGFRLHRSTCLGWVYLKQGRLDEAKACEQELLQLLPEAPGIKLDLMTYYTAAGDADKVFQYLEEAIQERIGDSMMFRSDNFLQAFKSDPRYQKLEAMVGQVPDMGAY